MLRGLAVVVDDGGRHLQALPLESLPNPSPNPNPNPNPDPNPNSDPSHLQALPLESLPATAAPRFQALFKVKPAQPSPEPEPEP
jgi:hypothetical protein